MKNLREKVENRKTEAWVKFHLSGASFLYGMRGWEFNIMLGILEMTRGHGNFGLPKGVKEQIAEYLDTKLVMVNKAIINLTKMEVLVRVGHGTYSFNPKIFIRG